MKEWKVTLQDRVVRKFRIEEGQTLVLGRGSEADVVIDNAAISRRHLSLQLLNGACFVGDLGSTNGTQINGAQVLTPTVVERGDVVSMGKFQLVPVAAKETKTPPLPQVDLDHTVFMAPRQAAVSRPAVTRPPRLTVVRGRCEPAGCSTEHQPAITVGKGRGCDLRIRGWFLGAPHCRVVEQGGGHQLVHLGGWRSTTLNGSPLRGTAPLQRGDVIGVGPVRLRFE